MRDRQTDRQRIAETLTAQNNQEIAGNKGFSEAELFPLNILNSSITPVCLSVPLLLYVYLLLFFFFLYAVICINWSKRYYTFFFTVTV